MKGSALRGALAAMPTGLQRMSPGVYRNAQGQLVGNQGQGLPRQQPMPQPQQQPQQQYDASMQAGELARNTSSSFGGQGMQNQSPPPFAPGSVDQIMRDRFNQMQPGYLQFPQGQQPPIQNLMYRYPAQSQMPDVNQIVNNNQKQPQQLQQQQTVSGLLQRFR